MQWRLSGDGPAQSFNSLRLDCTDCAHMVTNVLLQIGNAGSVEREGVARCQFEGIQPRIDLDGLGKRIVAATQKEVAVVTVNSK